MHLSYGGNIEYLVLAPQHVHGTKLDSPGLRISQVPHRQLYSIHMVITHNIDIVKRRRKKSSLLPNTNN